MGERTACENITCGMLHRDVKDVRNKAIEMDNRLGNAERDMAVLANKIEHVEVNQKEIKSSLEKLSQDVKSNSVLVATASKHAVWTASIVVPLITGVIGVFLAYFLRGA